MDYREQIKSPKWQKRRLEIMELDKFACQICGDTESTLNVHHLHYEKDRKYWEYEDYELITLCEYCHESEHDYHSALNRQINNLKKKGVTIHEILALLESIDIEIHLNRHDAIINITGDCWCQGDEANPDIKNLTKRRKDVKKIY